MKSFGRLLRKMRGQTPLEEIAERTRLEASYLASVEHGKRVADEAMARLILRHGFLLEKEEVTRLVLGIQLYDLGLRDNDLRQLTIGCITRSLPRQAREELRQVHQRYCQPN